MNPQTSLAIGCTIALYICVALCAMWAWQNDDWWLALPLTIIFVASTFALIWTFERWGGL